VRVFVAGATGAVGKMLIPLLVSSGHEVVGMTRSKARGLAPRQRSRGSCRRRIRAGGGVASGDDDDPAPVPAWLPELAAAIGAKPPGSVPVWLARAVAGELAVVAMTQIRDVSNPKAKRELGWEPTLASWRDGFRHGLFRDQR
jgi:nucleoside-diphosphate-sugar epimerase